MSKSVSELLSAAVIAAIKAGKEILDVYDGDHEVELKSDNSPLTIADQKSHNAIMKHLSFSNLPVLSEEGKSIPFEQRNQWDLFWMVDPLDGTKEFIKKNGEFTVNIALIKKSVPILGVIYLPVGDKLYFGTSETGSFVMNDAMKAIDNWNSSEDQTTSLLSISEKLPLKGNNKPFTVVASRSHLSPETELLVNGFRKQYGDVEFISKGSSIKICLVAEGTADVYPRLAPTMEWDTAAGQAIANFSGCTTTIHPSGKPVQYNKENLLNPFFIVQRQS